MRTCLLSQLKAQVNNENLIKLDTITIRCELTGISYSNRLLRFDGTSYNIRMITEGYSFLVDGVSTRNGTYSGAKTVNFPEGSFVVEVHNKYGLTKISIQEDQSGTKPFYFNWNEFSGCNAMTLLRIDDATLTLHKGSIDSLKENTALHTFMIRGEETNGNIGVLANKTGLITAILDSTSVGGELASLSPCHSLATLSIRENNVRGNLEDLGENVALTSLNINSNIKGSVEAFVKAQYDNGRTSTALQAITGRDLYKYVKFGGVTHTGSDFNYFAMGWDSDTVMWVYTGSSTNYNHIYAKGMTMEQANAKWPDSIGSITIVQ